MERQRKSNARISSSPSGQLGARSWACWLAAAPRGLTYAYFASHSPSCFGKRRFQRLGRTPTARRTHECPAHMAAVMCAAAVTTSATAGRSAMAFTAFNVRPFAWLWHPDRLGYGRPGGKAQLLAKIQVSNAMTAQQSETAPRAANRVLLPVPGLDIPSIWQVGPVTFHPAADTRVLAEAIVHEHGRPDIPASPTMLDDRISALCESAVAEVSVAGANDGEAMVTAAELTGTAVAIMRAVQHIRHRMNGMEHQTF